jgi:short-subunit dehydrogenase
MQSSFVASICWLSAALKLLPPGSAIGWLASLTARVPSMEWAAYAASKAGVEHYIRCIRQEAQGRGLSVTVCFPGCVGTGFQSRSGAPDPLSALLPEEVAPLIYDAVAAGLEVWAAAMDAGVVEMGDRHHAELAEAASKVLR